jgi:hypothetical protein
MAAKKRKKHRAKKSHKKSAGGIAGLTKRVTKLETLVKKSGLQEHYAGSVGDPMPYEP